MVFFRQRQEQIRSANAMRFRRRQFEIELLEDRQLLVATLYYSANNQIRSVLDDGSADTALFAGDMPVASPNGQYLAFRRGTNPTTYFNNLWVRDLTTGTERLASIGTTSYIVGYSFTVDSKSLLFDYADEMRQYELATSSSSRLINSGIIPEAPSIRIQDGRILAYGENSGLYLYNRTEPMKPRSPILNCVTFSQHGHPMDSGLPSCDARLSRVSTTKNCSRLNPRGLR